MLSLFVTSLDGHDACPGQVFSSSQSYRVMVIGGGLFDKSYRYPISPFVMIQILVGVADRTNYVDNHIFTAEHQSDL